MASLCSKLKKQGTGKNGIKWSLVLCCLSSFVLGISIFLPGWRVDPVGTTPLALNIGTPVGKAYIGFQWKEYGLIQVRATVQRAWNTVTHEICNFAAMGQVSQGAMMIANKVNAIDALIEDCESRETCMNGFHIHMQARCIGYQKIMKISMISIILCFMAVLMSLVGSLLAALAPRKKVGGVSFALYLTAALFALTGNLAWAIMTDMVFKDLSKTAWYPYPSLSTPWYINLVAVIMLFVGNAWFGMLVLPMVWRYDPHQERLEKQHRKMKVQMYKKAMGLSQDQGQGHGHAVQQTFPPPPHILDNQYQAQADYAYPQKYGQGAGFVDNAGYNQGNNNGFHGHAGMVLPDPYGSPPPNYDQEQAAMEPAYDPYNPASQHGHVVLR